MIEFRGVGKRYTPLLGKSVRAVHDFTLRVERGEVVGIAGPNGAGKSTLIALLLGYLVPSEGEVRVCGMRPRMYVERHGVGYLSELISIPPAWRAEGALQRYATLAGVPERLVTSRVNDIIETLGLDDHRSKRIRALSKGNLQRVGLGQALLREDMELLILDEPTHGLDPVWTQRFRDIVAGLRRPNRTMLIASHNLDELERVCDRVVIIDQGQLQRVVDVRASAPSVGAVVYRLRVGSGMAVVMTTFPHALDLGQDQLEVHADSLEMLNIGVARAIDGGARFASVTPAYSGLEQQFREVVGAQDA